RWPRRRSPSPNSRRSAVGFWERFPPQCSIVREGRRARQARRRTRVGRRHRAPSHGQVPKTRDWLAPWAPPTWAEEVDPFIWETPMHVAPIRRSLHRADEPAPRSLGVFGSKERPPRFTCPAARGTQAATSYERRKGTQPPRAARGVPALYAVTHPRNALRARR